MPGAQPHVEPQKHTGAGAGADVGWRWDSAIASDVLEALGRSIRKQLVTYAE